MRLEQMRRHGKHAQRAANASKRVCPRPRTSNASVGLPIMPDAVSSGLPTARHRVCCLSCLLWLAGCGLHNSLPFNLRPIVSGHCHHFRGSGLLFVVMSWSCTPS